MDDPWGSPWTADNEKNHRAPPSPTKSTRSDLEPPPRVFLSVSNTEFKQIKDDIVAAEEQVLALRRRRNTIKEEWEAAAKTKAKLESAKEQLDGYFREKKGL